MFVMTSDGSGQPGSPMTRQGRGTPGHRTARIWLHSVRDGAHDIWVMDPDGNNKAPHDRHGDGFRPEQPLGGCGATSIATGRWAL